MTLHFHRPNQARHTAFRWTRRMGQPRSLPESAAQVGVRYRHPLYIIAVLAASLIFQLLQVPTSILGL